MLSLLFCLAAGIHPIFTSSSDERLDITRNFGSPDAAKIINYNEHPNRQEEAPRITNGRGVDIVFLKMSG